MRGLTIAALIATAVVATPHAGRADELTHRWVYVSTTMLVEKNVESTIKLLDRLAPDGDFMQHDEIRIAGWDAACATRRLTCGQILADNVRRCAAILRKADPGKPVYVWSDMFDPHHNAGRTGRYYLVKKAETHAPEAGSLQ